MRPPLIALMLGLALFVSACASSVAAPVSDDPAPVEPDDPDETASWPPMVVDWYGDFALDLPNGWTVRSCEGDAPLICFHDEDDRILGSVESGSYPLPDDFDGDAYSYLNAHAEDFLAGMEEDRAEGCAHLAFEAVPAAPANVGGLRGVKTGFSMVDDTGTEMERHVLYWAVHDGAVFGFTAGAYDEEDGCLERMGEFQPHDLGIALPYIDRIVQDTPLPREIPDGGAVGALVDGTHTVRIASMDAPVRVAYVGAVDVLSGREAVDAAREDGVLTDDEDEMPNDVYVRSSGGGTVAVGVSADAEVAVFDCSSTCRHVRVGLDDFLAGRAHPMNGEHAIFDITIDGGDVVAITELYLP